MSCSEYEVKLVKGETNLTQKVPYELHIKSHGITYIAKIPDNCLANEDNKLITNENIIEILKIALEKHAYECWAAKNDGIGITFKIEVRISNLAPHLETLTFIAYKRAEPVVATKETLEVPLVHCRPDLRESVQVLERMQDMIFPFLPPMLGRYEYLLHLAKLEIKRGKKIVFPVLNESDAWSPPSVFRVIEPGRPISASDFCKLDCQYLIIMCPLHEGVNSSTRFHPNTKEIIFVPLGEFPDSHRTEISMTYRRVQEYGIKVSAHHLMIPIDYLGRINHLEVDGTNEAAVRSLFAGHKYKPILEAAIADVKDIASGELSCRGDKYLMGMMH